MGLQLLHFHQRKNNKSIENKDFDIYDYEITDLKKIVGGFEQYIIP